MGALGSGRIATIFLLILACRAPAAGDPAKPANKDAKLGLLVNDPKASPGYTLLAPANSTNTYLIDMEGRVVNTWKSDCQPGLSAYFLENGHLLRTGQVKNPPFFGGGSGGRIQEFTWDGKLVWDYTYVNDTQLPNHDVCKLPNGNVLINVWEKKSAKDAVAAGRRPETVGQADMLSAALLEVQPTGEKTGKIVWEWHAWDHLIQEFDAKQANHGDAAAHPERIDLNFGEATIAAMVAKPEELQKLRSIGYVGAPGRKPQAAQPDWLHINSVAYNPELDQIMLSAFEFSEIWIIDHGTTTAEAAGRAGGKYGKGGDLLYRWGNPRAYRAGAVKNQKLFGQHNAHWIPKGLPGEGRVLIFNNGMKRIGGAYSSVDEIALPVDDKGRYEAAAGKAFGPEKAVWSYSAPKRTDFYAPFISGAQRLANGDTLICSGTNGTVFEAAPKGEIVWKYVNPEKGNSPFAGPPGPPPFGGPPKLGQILPTFLQGFMNLTDDQKKLLTEAEKETADKLAKVFSADQKKQFEEKPLGFGELPPAGLLLSSAVQDRLKLSDEQKKQTADLQKTVDEKLAAILKEDQKKQIKRMQDMAKGFAAGPPGPPPGGPPGGLPGFGPPGGFPGFGPPGGGGLFRAPRYAADFPGLKGKELKPGKTVEELQQAARGDDPPKNADPVPVQLTAEQDHKRLMDLLKIESLRQGANGFDPKAANAANYDESKANPYPKLPDPLVLKDGALVKTAEMWWKQRRPEIVEDFDREVYGRAPKETPKVKWEATDVKKRKVGDVDVVTKQLVGHVDNSAYPQITVDIKLTLTTPADAKGPVPVMMEFGFAGFGPPGFGESNPGSWQHQVLAKGWGYAILIPTSVQADNGAGLTKGIIGLCNKGQPRKVDDWGALRAWAWGASRALDYFETDKAVDAKQVGIEGLSRYGKAAIVTLAYDQRFAVGFIGSSGEGGVKLHRRNCGELVENVASSGEYHWMAGNFLKYAGPLKWGDLPVDSHELVALCAPRPVFISCGTRQAGDGWVDAKGMFLAGVGAGPVYKLLGKKDMGATEMPEVETGLIDGEVAFRQHSGGHTTGPNWPTFLKFVDRYIKVTPDKDAPKDAKDK
jgi:Arylsulfotransferase (ASST)